jgi:proteasome activator subunit 4
MRLDGDVRENKPPNGGQQSGALPRKSGFVAGSHALDSLDQIITSTESFFHPSNNGAWTASVGLLCCVDIGYHFLNMIKKLTMFIHRLTSEFTKRWMEEELESCKTPVVCSPFTEVNLFFSSGNSRPTA